MVDILRVEPDGLHLVEVKSSTRVHDVYYHDMAFQYDLLRRCGYEVNSVSLMHIDNSYVFDGKLDLARLFRVEDCTERVVSLAADVRERAAYSQGGGFRAPRSRVRIKGRRMCSTSPVQRVCCR